MNVRAYFIAIANIAFTVCLALEHPPGWVMFAIPVTVFSVVLVLREPK